MSMSFKCMMLLPVIGCLPLAADQFAGGLWKEFVYDKPSTKPVVFGGESRSEAACAPDYCIYLDMWYDDGTPVWGERAEWRQGTHGWESTTGAFVPKKPVKKIQFFAFLRKGTGKAEFRNLWLERREGRGEVLWTERKTMRPYADADRCVTDVFEGRKVVRRTNDVPSCGASLTSEAVPKDGFAVWTADSQRKITPLTFPAQAELEKPQTVSLELAKRERESFQIQVTCGAGTEWTQGDVVLAPLKNAEGETLKGDFVWERVGYVAREPGYHRHSQGVCENETWLPDPLLPAAPFKVRKASTQGIWLTVRAAPDAKAGVYSGDVVVREKGEPRATVRLSVRVRDFSLPETFGMPTAFCLMDGFTRAQYGKDRWREMKRQSQDVMLDHRLNPDDISRTTPPEIPDLIHARARGMNRFNILNIVPEPDNPDARWVCFSSPEATFNEKFYDSFKARLTPYVAELRKHDLVKHAYLYGFDEREEEYYAGIDKLWRQIKADFPDIPVMTTAMMYRDKVRGQSKSPHLETTDWFCPLTSVYKPGLSAELRAKGKQVWWYTCCGPVEPYANMASLEYPTIEGRLLGWMTHLYRADGLLFWHVNFWDGNPGLLDESDTFFPSWHTYSSLHMPGDGIFLYPGKEHILPSVRLAQVRDGVEDHEWLQMAAAKAGAGAADAKSRMLITSMTEFTRNPAKLRAVRTAVGDLITGRAQSAENAAPADELARKQPADVEIPTAPEGYRRPKDWKPVLYSKGLLEIARDHSGEMCARAAKQMAKVKEVIANGPFKATGKSIDSHRCPEWFIDAKLGIFVDWGAWSVASWCPYVKGSRLYPDWYEYRCRTDPTTIRYHEKNWGRDFKSDHLLALFRGDNFDAPALMKTFRECGAKYVVPFLKHHSGFCLWDCSYTFRDTMDGAARRDFAKEMAEACRSEGLKFGFYTSQAGEWEYPILQDDGSVKIAINSTKLVPYSPDMEWKCSGKVAVKDFVHEYVVPQAAEFIDKYDPDILWNDFDWMTYADENGSYEVAAYMYNKAAGRKEVAFNDRHGKARPEEIAGRFTKRPREWLRTVRGDFFTDEWGDTEECLDPAKWHPWESCSGISKAYGNHWMENFDASMVMSEKEFICHFSGIVARGGNLLLLVNLDPQGGFPEVQRKRLEQIGEWLKRYGEAIYSTRICAPFNTKTVDYTQSKDGKIVYAIVKEPATEVTLECELPDDARVTVVGGDVRLATRRAGNALVVTVPPALAKGTLPFALRCAL